MPKLSIRRLLHTPEFDALLAGLPARTLVVVDQRRNIGALVCV